MHTAVSKLIQVAENTTYSLSNVNSVTEAICLLHAVTMHSRCSNNRVNTNRVSMTINPIFGLYNPFYPYRVQFRALFSDNVISDATALELWLMGGGVDRRRWIYAYA